MSERDQRAKKDSSITIQTRHLRQAALLTGLLLLGIAAGKLTESRENPFTRSEPAPSTEPTYPKLPPQRYSQRLSGPVLDSQCPYINFDINRMEYILPQEDSSIEASYVIQAPLVNQGLGYSEGCARLELPGGIKRPDRGQLRTQVYPGFMARGNPSKLAKFIPPIGISAEMNIQVQLPGVIVSNAIGGNSTSDTRFLVFNIVNPNLSFSTSISWEDYQIQTATLNGSPVPFPTPTPIPQFGPQLPTT